MKKGVTPTRPAVTQQVRLSDEREITLKEVSLSIIRTALSFAALCPEILIHKHTRQSVRGSTESIVFVIYRLV